MAFSPSMLICNSVPRMVAHQFPFPIVFFMKMDTTNGKCVLFYALSRCALPYFIIKMIFFSATVIQISFWLLEFTSFNRNEVNLANNRKRKIIPFNTSRGRCYYFCFSEEKTKALRG